MKLQNLIKQISLNIRLYAKNHVNVADKHLLCLTQECWVNALFVVTLGFGTKHIMKGIFLNSVSLQTHIVILSLKLFIYSAQWGLSDPLFK